MDIKKRYKFSYQTIITYQSMVSHYHFLLRCTPFDIPCQRIEEQQLHLLAPAKITCQSDTFGNTIHYGYLNEEHDLFVVASNGIIECSRYMVEDKSPMAYYLSETALTRADKAITEFNKSIDSEKDSLATAIAISAKLHAKIKYQSGATSIETSASESFEQGRGVCQDYAHILITLCRQRGVHARYVVGLVVGTGETHAWVEIWSDGRWWGVDPTHDKFIEYDYIKLAHGRDAADTSVVRGVKHGLAAHSTQIRVVVEEL